MREVNEQLEVYHKGRKNLWAAIALSVPGPLALGIGLLDVQNATQVADFTRRTCEFLSIFLAYIVFEVSVRMSEEEMEKRKKLEHLVNYFTGCSMVLSGVIMVYVAITGFGAGKGSVTTSLIFAILGAIVNARLFIKYRVLENAVLSVQAKLHRVKMLLDCWMIVILILFTMTSSVVVKSYADFVGSCSIALYIMWSGIRIFKEK